MLYPRDIRGTPLYEEAKSLYASIRGPGTGMICDAAELSTNGIRAIYAGTLVEELCGVAPTRICVTDLATGDTRVVTFGPNSDRLPKFSPNGRDIAFLSDRRNAGDFQLYLVDPLTGAARPAPPVEGWVEYLHWSPDGRSILLGTAGYGADVAGVQGAVSSQERPAVALNWLPAIATGSEAYRWRRLWIYDLANDRMHEVGPARLNIWEAVWCGNDAVVAVASSEPGEAFWYSAHLHILGITGTGCTEVFVPNDQLGCPAASVSGKYIAVIEALCSDRFSVAGDLRLIETASGSVCRVDTRGVDITYVEWRSDDRILLAGHRGSKTVVGVYDTTIGSFAETWCSEDVTTGGVYATVSGCNERGDCVLVGESFTRAPEIAVIENGAYRTVKSFDVGYTEQANVIAAFEPITWKARDELELEGWLLRPRTAPPYPLVMIVHGGPVWHTRPLWLGRRNVHVLMLLRRGYAVFFPNPRGSSGRGQAFARLVQGDLGGADADDLLSGLDSLVERRLADPGRLGVTGISYGGFMTCWLICQDTRFSAAIPVAPHTNNVTHHLLSNIPQFVSRFLSETYNLPAGKYFQRSPIMHAHKVKTPTLNICGALDRCTPPEEAAQFHNALLENDIESVLVTYPEEGHGIRQWPAVIDYAARVVGWFESHIAV